LIAIAVKPLKTGRLWAAESTNIAVTLM
jgi:hypothetical protein